MLSENSGVSKLEARKYDSSGVQYQIHGVVSLWPARSVNGITQSEKIRSLIAMEYSEQSGYITTTYLSRGSLTGDNYREIIE